MLGQEGGGRFIARMGAVMIPVSRASAFPTKMLTSNRPDGMSGLGQAPSNFPADEHLTHAPLLESSVHQEHLPQKSPTIRNRTGAYPKPGGRNKFQELLEADAVARAAMEASKRPDSIPTPKEGRRKLSDGGNDPSSTASREEFPFALSVLGNRIKLSTNLKTP